MYGRCGSVLVIKGMQISVWFLTLLLSPHSTLRIMNVGTGLEITPCPLGQVKPGIGQKSIPVTGTGNSPYIALLGVSSVWVE